MDKRRKDTRTAAESVGLINVLIQKKGAWEPVARAMLLDVSKGGVGIQMDQGIAPGTKVRLENRWVIYSGVVRHCTMGMLSAGFKVGIQFTSAPVQRA
jgi:c-di-GMP-binding flagellar brake protein YcgR